MTFYVNLKKSKTLPNYWVSPYNGLYCPVYFSGVAILFITILFIIPILISLFTVSFPCPYSLTIFLMLFTKIFVILTYQHLAYTLDMIVSYCQIQQKNSEELLGFAISVYDVILLLLLSVFIAPNLSLFFFPGASSLLVYLAFYPVSVLSIVLATMIICKTSELIFRLYNHIKPSVKHLNINIGGGMSSKEMHHETKHTLSGIREGSGQQATSSAKYTFGK